MVLKKKTVFYLKKNMFFLLCIAMAMDTQQWLSESAYSSLFVNQTSHHSHAHVTSVCFWQPMWEVVCLWAVPRCNLWTWTPMTPVYHWLVKPLTIGIYRSRLTADSGPSEELWMMNWWWAASLHDFSAWG